MMIADVCEKLLIAGDEAQLTPPKSTALTVEKINKVATLSYTLVKAFRSTNEEIIERSKLCRDDNVVKEDCNIKELANNFLKDDSDEKVFIAHRNVDILKMSKLLNKKPVVDMKVLSHTRYECKTNDLIINNGSLLTIKELIDDAWTEPLEALEEDDNYFIASFVEEPLIDVVHCYIGTQPTYREDYLQPAWKHYRSIATKLQDKYKYKDISDIWKHKHKLSTTDYKAFAKSYAMYKKVSNVLVLTDARVSTVYKAQGRGFENVYLYTKGMSQKHKYVGITRAIKSLKVA